MSKAGLQECLRYSLPPNSLLYCGPEETDNVLEYRKTGIVDQGLAEHISKYNTLYSYLSFIAYENSIKDPFDIRVVKAYWIGNSLLRKFDTQRFYRYLRETLNLKKRLSRIELETLFGKIPKGALPNHAFHVLNVPWRTGHLPIEHTIETMDKCRIGWGIIKIQNQNLKIRNLKVLTKPLIYKNGKLMLGDYKERQIANNIKGTNLVHVEDGDLVTFHWGIVCNKIGKQEARSLQYYTQLAINLANEDIRRRKHFG